MSKVNSKNKGKRGELELCHKLAEHGIEARRSQQYCGMDEGEADIVGLFGIYAEVKRVEALNVSKAMSQAERDAINGRMPTVFHRKNGEPWMVTMRLDDWAEMYKVWTYRKNVEGVK